MSYAEWGQPFIGELSVGKKVRVDAKHPQERGKDDGLVVEHVANDTAHGNGEKVVVRMNNKELGDITFIRRCGERVWRYLFDDPFVLGQRCIATSENAVTYQIRRYN